MHAALLLALIGYAGAGELGQTVDVVGLQSELRLDIAAHLLAPCLCAEDPGAQLEVLLPSLFLHDLSDVLGVGGRAHDRRGTEVLHELELALRVAGGHRDRHAAELFAAVVRAEAAREKAVTVGDLDGVLLGQSRGGKRAGHTVAPEIEITLRVVRDHALAGRAGGRVDADDVFSRDGEQAVRVGIAQVVLAHERQLPEVVDALDVVRRDALLLHFLPVVRLVLPDVTHLADQFFVLQRTELVARHALDLFLIVIMHRISLPFSPRGTPFC